MKLVNTFLMFGMVLGLTACLTSNSRILDGGDQLKLRSMQTRAFDTSDKVMVVRNVISTLQDLSFVIDKADAQLGTVTATKLDGHKVRMTVTVRPKSKAKRQMLVRGSARYDTKSIEDPEVYQQFFTALQKSMFLTAHAVE